MSSHYTYQTSPYRMRLRADILYQYQCGDPKQGTSDVHYFRAMPVSGPKSYPSRIAVVGDLGLTYNTTSTIEHLTSNHDPVLLLSDVSYADLYLMNGTGSDCYYCSFPQTPIHESYQPRWDYWGREEQIKHQTFVAYSSQFAFPSKESKSSSTLYYSFNAGGVHFIMLSAYTYYDRIARQYKWLEKDLAKVNRKVTPWLVATWHPPWYSTYKAHYREDLLYKYKVDIVFNGHVHAYERSNKVYNYTLDPCGPVYITIGDGGNQEMMAITHADEPGNCPKMPKRKGNFCWDLQPEYSVYRESSFGHGILELTLGLHLQVRNETHALWTWHQNKDSYRFAGDLIYIVRQPDKCPINS
ncbi:hypothetical protein UlMin_013465 [Ulmus minor]